MTKTLLVLTFLLHIGVQSAQAQGFKEFAIKPQSWISCQPGDTTASNLFNCCVVRARAIQIENVQTLQTVHLIADPNLCRDPKLQELKLELAVKTEDGVYSYRLKSPRVEETAFNSERNLPTKFFLYFEPYFDLPRGDWAANFLPFMAPQIGVDEKEMSGLSNRIFGGSNSTALGLKMTSSVLTAQRQYLAACPPHVSGQCRYEEKKFEEVWLNQDSQEQTQRLRTEVNYLGL